MKHDVEYVFVFVFNSKKYIQKLNNNSIFCCVLYSSVFELLNILFAFLFFFFHCSKTKIDDAFLCENK
jgi:hypothetical protein